MKLNLSPDWYERSLPRAGEPDEAGCGAPRLDPIRAVPWWHTLVIWAALAWGAACILGIVVSLGRIAGG